MKKITNLILITVATLTFLSGCSGWETSQRGGQIKLSYLDPNTRFKNAVKANDFDEAIKYANSQNVNRMVDGDYPIIRAASKGDHRSAMALANRGANVQVRNSRGESLAYIAASNGDKTAAQTYAARGAGTTHDADSGYDRWVAEAPERKRRAEQNMAFGAGFLWWLMGGGQSSQSDDSERCYTCGDYKGSYSAGSGLCMRCTAVSLH